MKNFSNFLFTALFFCFLGTGDLSAQWFKIISKGGKSAWPRYRMTQQPRYPNANTIKYNSTIPNARITSARTYSSSTLNYRWNSNNLKLRNTSVVGYKNNIIKNKKAAITTTRSKKFAVSDVKKKDLKKTINNRSENKSRNWLKGKTRKDFGVPKNWVKTKPRKGEGIY